MKKFKVAILGVTAAVAVSAVAAGLAGCSLFGGKKFEYTLAEDEQSYILTKYNLKDEESVEVPAKYKGKPVTAIGGSAFKYYIELSNGQPFATSNFTLKTVTLPDTIQSIGNEAFYNLKALESINLPEGLEKIGANAFSGCESLTEVTIPNSVVGLGLNSYYECTGLTKLTLGNGITEIGMTTFYGCSSLETVEFGSNIVNIGISAFEDCNIKSLTFPDTVKWIDDDAFKNNAALATVSVPDSVTLLGANVFYNTAYYNNEENWEEGVLYAGNHLIAVDDEKTGEVVVKEGTLTIAGEAMAFCDSISSVTVPEGVVTLGDYAFKGCDALFTISLPDTLEYIGYDVLDLAGYGTQTRNWSGHLLYVGKYVVDSNYSVQTPEDLYITNGTLGIACGVFKNVSAIKTVTIPESVKHIGYRAFDGCSNLTKVTFAATEGWTWSSTDAAQSSGTISADSLADPASAANLLKSLGHETSTPIYSNITYYHYWHRIEA